MRSTRFISAFAALVLAASLVGFVGSPAQAAKPKHDLSAVRGGETAKGAFFITGKISTLANKKITVQKKLKGKTYRFYKTAQLNGKGKFTVGIAGKIGDCFKVVAPGTKNYKTAKKVVGCIVPG